MSRDELITNNLNLIHYAIKKAHIQYKSEDEYEYYYGIGLESLVKNADNYKEGYGKPSTFLYKCIYNDLLKGIYFINMDKRKANNMTISLNKELESGDEPIDFIPNEDEPLEEQLDKKIKLEAIRKAIDRIPILKDQEVIKMYYGIDNSKNMSLQEIADIYGVSRNAIAHRLVRARNNVIKIVNEKEVIQDFNMYKEIIEELKKLKTKFKKEGKDKRELKLIDFCIKLIELIEKIYH